MTSRELLKLATGVEQMAGRGVVKTFGKTSSQGLQALRSARRCLHVRKAGAERAAVPGDKVVRTKSSAVSVLYKSLRKTSETNATSSSVRGVAAIIGADDSWKDQRKFVMASVAMLAALSGLGVYISGDVNLAEARNPSPDDVPPGGSRTERCPLGFPYFTRKEVSKHKRAEDRIYVTYRDGVYDVTDFVSAHPGGERILLAAGSAIDPYWAMYQQHSTKQVLEILASLRIGTLYKHEMEDQPMIAFDDPYANDPPRVHLGKVRCEKPYNAETVIELIPDNYITPVPMHYKRHHHPVPSSNEDDYRLVLAFEDANILQLTTKDLRTRFKKHEIPVTLQCAGNRRTELGKVDTVQGLEWDCGAISTAVWGGCLLRDVLEFTGFGDESALIERAGVKHIQFEGLDKPYDASIPIEKALNKFGDVLVAYEMNGQPIPREHGGPVRIIVPGHLAARSVKWCHRITASKGESHSGWQRGIAYKGAPSYMKSFDNVDPETLPSVQELPVNSAICTPRPETKIDYEEGSITLKGWAWSGGGRNIIRVDVSADGGRTWQPAELGQGAEQSQNRAWAWTFWEAEVDIPPELCKPGAKVDLCCRAVDISMNHQPEHLESVWNLRGIMNNSYHHVEVEMVAPEE
mmetsp:Transcript_7062/g.14181  ORF Transcript_7062/g.14181 Transcript_7062/m.14181 type:complete len:633 (-) Transcript_7062:285-2183(-)